MCQEANRKEPMLRLNNILIYIILIHIMCVRVHVRGCGCGCVCMCYFPTNWKAWAKKCPSGLS